MGKGFRLGDKNQSKILKHHTQVNAGKARRAARIEQRQSERVFKATTLRQRYDDLVEDHNTAVLVFYIGVILLLFTGIYYIGAILYG